MMEHYTDNEKNLILILRGFDFLRSYNYIDITISPYGNDLYIEYYNYKIKQSVHITYSSRNYLDIRIINKSFTKFKRKEINLDNLFLDLGCNLNSYFNSMEDTIRIKSEFIKKEMISILEGKSWAEEFLRSAAKDYKNFMQGILDKISEGY